MELNVKISSEGNLTKAGFQRIYEQFFNYFFRISMQFLHSEPDACEIVQDAFVALWENRDKLHKDTNIKNYLFILVRNKSLNKLRDRKKEQKHTNSKEYLIDSISYRLLNETGEEILLYDELFELIMQAIGKLPEQCREVFRMSRFDQLSNKEIAEKLDITVKAVEANITRALKILRTDLHKYLIPNLNPPSNKNLHSVLLSFL